MDRMESGELLETFKIQSTTTRCENMNVTVLKKIEIYGQSAAEHLSIIL